MNRFEQLIEYVINDETKKAEELFHEIVVAKSRSIYESMMAQEAKEEELDEAAEEELDEAAEEELDEAAEEDIEEGAMGGDAADDLIDEIEADESRDMSMEAEEEEEEFEMGSDDAGDSEGGSEPASKDDILNLEDKLDQLMAEFEDLMGGDDMGGDDMGDGDDFGADEGGDAIAVDDTEEMIPMAEAVSLKAAPKPTTSEEGGVNKKSVVAANAGAKGPIGSTVKPVHTGGEMGGKHDAAGAYSNQTKDIIGDFQNKAGTSMKGLKTAPKPVTGQASGVNTKSPVAKA
jgi:hypothetical protein